METTLNELITDITMKSYAIVNVLSLFRKRYCDISSFKLIDKTFSITCTNRQYDSVFRVVTKFSLH